VSQDLKALQYDDKNIDTWPNPFEWRHCYERDGSGVDDKAFEESELDGMSIFLFWQPAARVGKETCLSEQLPFNTRTHYQLATNISQSSLQTLNEDNGWAWGTSEWKPINDDVQPGENRLERGEPDPSFLVELPSQSEFVPCVASEQDPQTGDQAPSTPTGTKLLEIQQKAQEMQGQQEALGHLRSNSIGTVGSMELGTETDRLARENKTLKTQFQSLLDSNRNIQMVNESLKNEVDALKLELSQMTGRMRLYVSEDEEKRREIQHLQGALEHAENAKRDADIELTRTRTNLNDAERTFSAHRSEGQARMHDIQSTLSQQGAEIEIARKDLEEQTKRASFFEQECKRMKDEIDDERKRALFLEEEYKKNKGSCRRRGKTGILFRRRVQKTEKCD